MEENEISLKVDEFIDRLNFLPHSSPPDPMEAKRLANLFLHARRFNVDRAIDLYKSYRHMRYSQQLDDINPLDAGVRRELLSEKFTVLPHSSPTDPTVVIFSVKLHWPPSCTDRDVLKGILYQLDAALVDTQTQQQGIIVIYDMTNAKYSNFGADLSMKLLNLLTGSYPARLRNVLIIAAPFWFRPPYHLSRLFVKDKIKERIFAIDKLQLPNFLSPNSIPTQLGGRLVHQHTDWLKTCFSRMSAPIPASSSSYYLSVPSITSSVQSVPVLLNGHASIPRRSSLSLTSTGSRSLHRTTSLLHRKQHWMTDPTGSPSAKRIAFNGGDCNSNNRITSLVGKSGITDDYLATDVNSLSRLKVGQFLDQFRNSVPGKYEREFDTLFKDAALAGPISRFASKSSWSKNRYVDVPCLDQSSVLLPNHAYIHANFVHGYNRPNAYILTQGPLESSAPDFWQMIWCTNATTIVMLTKTMENGRVKCSQYWPSLNGVKQARTTIFPPNLCVTNLEETVEANGLYRRSQLQISLLDAQGNAEPGCIRNVNHLLFLGWPDFDVPKSAEGFLTFLDAVNDFAGVDKTTTSAPTITLPPLVIHCSAGIGRTGTFTAVDICLDQARGEGFVDVQGTVSRIRRQRACSVQLGKQYAFIFLALSTRLSS